ncbi:hypothetical protein J7K27_10300 [Candidatus Bathyarchaeota archaeon]|nr:hypothetical protein [Candidatus Bathyarchaeota archaeon]
MIEELRREFRAFLHAKGFPKGIDDKAIFEAEREVMSEAVNGKRLAEGDWYSVFGGCHSDDVAVVKLLAEKLGLKQGVDWDYGLELDDYHFEIAYGKSEKVYRLIQLVQLYFDASAVFLAVSMRLSGKKHVSRAEIQKMFAEEWRRLDKAKWEALVKVEDEILRKFMNKDV